MRIKFVIYVFLSFFIFLSAFAISSVDDRLEKHISNKSEFIGFIEIKRDRAIDQSTYLHVKFALDYFKKKNVSFIILKLNTPGGEVFAASNISKLLKEIDQKDKIPVIAFIDDWAISAGAMLAYSCRFIAVTKTSSMGAAEPVLMGKEGMVTASEKINSALRSEFSNLASFYDRNSNIAKAMVDKDIILVKRDNEIIQIRTKDEIKRNDIIVTNQGKLLTLDSSELIKYRVADFFVDTNLSDRVSELEKENKLWPSEKSPVLSYPYFKKFDKSVIISYSDWKVSFFSFITNPAVVSILFFVMMIGGYIEFSTPGFGVFGSLAIGALSLILLGSFASYAINWIELIILGIGLLLLLLEIFVIPGFGIAGILGIFCIFLGLTIITLPNFSEFILSMGSRSYHIDFGEIINRVTWIFGAILFSFIVMSIITRFILPRFLRKSPLIHTGTQEGYKAGHLKNEMPEIGKQALTYTSLRPSGKIIIDGTIMDATAEIGFINKGEKVTISKLLGNTILVRKIL